MKKKITKKTVFYSVFALGIIAVLTLNILLDLLWQKNTLYFDTTAEDLYTLSDGMIAEMDAVGGDVLITFCADPDILLSNYESRYVYIMAQKLAKRYENISVECINSKKNPELLDKYKTTSASTIDVYDVIISSGAKYRVMSSSQFWTKDENDGYWAFNGEYKAACAILSVTAVESPLVCITTTHGEKYYNPDPSDVNSNPEYSDFYNLLLLAGLKVSYIDLDKDEIPNDCVLLIMNGPTVDYTAAPDDIYNLESVSPVEKIDRFLTKNNSLMITKDPFVSLPAMEEYIKEWGMEFGDDKIKSGDIVSGTDRLFAEYADSENDTIGYGLFSDVASLSTAPKTVMKESSQINLIWMDSDTSSDEKYISPGLSMMANAVLRSGKDSLAYNKNGEWNPVDSYGNAAERDECGNYVLSAISVRSRFVGVNYFYAYVFASGTSAMLSNEYLGTQSYANSDLTFSTVRTLTRTDRYASDDLGAITLNTANYGGKILLSDELSESEREEWENGKLVRVYGAISKGANVAWTILIAIIPIIVIPAVCIYMCIKRRNM